MTALRAELTKPPSRIQALPVDERGYPEPYFVAWIDGKPEFRAMDPNKWMSCVNEKRCWVCGERLGANLAFVAGPMGGINRTSSEPPSHLECAHWSAINCPFLARPHMVRREDEVINKDKMVEMAAGIALTRNPGVTMIWVTKGYKVFADPKGKPLIEMGDPHDVIWFARQRRATREEVIESVTTGLPVLIEVAKLEGKDAVREANRRAAWLERWYPL